MEAALERLVWDRARRRCEYCQLPQDLSDLTLQIDHTTAQKHKGPTTSDNLALACVHCNLHKGTDLTGIDPVTGKITRLEQGMKLVSLAPRYIGDFEKGVDYKGDLRAFEKSLTDHAAIAQFLGPYKLSLHSGSDKLSIYSTFARVTKGQFHVKTAGTSYLEALRVVARSDDSLFRRIINFALERYDTDKATYHVSATLKDGPKPQGLDAWKLEEIYIGDWSQVPAGEGFTGLGRQILHCTFGSVLTHPELKPQVLAVLKDNQKLYDEVLADHFEKHLAALNSGMK